MPKKLANSEAIASNKHTNPHHQNSNGNHHIKTELDLNGDAKKQENKWMNPKAGRCCAYAPTMLEHYANIITHAVIHICSHISYVFF